MSSTKYLAAAIGTASGAAVIAAVSAAPAYGDNGYFYLPCATSAVSGAGTYGTGCDQYGAPQWMPATPESVDDIVNNSLSHIDKNYRGMHPYFNDDPITETLDQSMETCGKQQAFAVLLSIVTDTEEVVALKADKALAGCAKSAAEAAGWTALTGGSN